MNQRTFRAEREFGLIVGTALTLLGSWWIYRGKFLTLAHVIIPIGLVIVLLGLTYPRALIYLNKAWMWLAEVLSFISTHIILAFVFFLIITPIGVIKRWLGWDPLNRRSGSQSTYWRAYSGRQRNSRYYEKMY